ncbi:DMT family transporter [Candidatus Parcubacteria bacterium]|nr:DMT family transporter [Candidatus Parcubacteria bacterium]
MKYIKFGSVAVVAAALLWSLDGLLRRELYTLPASVIVFWEHLFGFIILLPFIIYSYKAFRKLSKKQWQAIIGVSFLSGALGTILYTAALTKIQFIPFSVVVLLQQLQPVFAISAAALLLKEPLSRKFMGLAATALVAAYFVSFPDMKINLDTGSGTLIAALFAVGAAAAWGVSTAFSKYALKDTSSLHITALRFGFTPIFALLFVLFSGDSAALTQITADQFKYLIAITFSTGMLALLIYYFGLKRIPASRSTILELTWPLSAVVIGFLFLGESLSATQALGSLVLLGTIYLIAKDANKLALAKANSKT